MNINVQFRYDFQAQIKNLILLFTICYIVGLIFDGVSS